MPTITNRQIGELAGGSINETPDSETTGYTFREAMYDEARETSRISVNGTWTFGADPAVSQKKKFKVGDKVRILWDKTSYLKASSYQDVGTVREIYDSSIRVWKFSPAYGNFHTLGFSAEALIKIKPFKSFSKTFKYPVTKHGAVDKVEIYPQKKGLDNLF